MHISENDISDVDEALVIHQTHKLIKLIKTQNFYRKGIYLYDVEKLEPMYNLVEYAWTFCAYPFVANKVSERLIKILEDIPDCDKMSIEELEEHAMKMWDDGVCENYHRESGKLKRTVQLCRFLHFFCTKKIIDAFDNSSEILETMLLDLCEEMWEPVTYFSDKYCQID